MLFVKLSHISENCSDVFIEKYLNINGLVHFKPVWFKGQP